ncbi:MAG: hypothetical protein U0228_13880 [Myxococcaceae bacterium]
MRPFLFLLVVGLAVGASSCSRRQKPVKVVKPADVMTIMNDCRATVTLQWRPCGGGEAAWNPLVPSPLKPGQSLAVGLMQQCVDLQAVGGEGKVYGLQTDLTMVPGTVWTIR